MELISKVNDTIKGIEYGVKFVSQDNKLKEELKFLIENIKEREDRLFRIMGINFNIKEERYEIEYLRIKQRS